jgi:bacterial/archaeal transporter family-2 protein
MLREIGMHWLLYGFAAVAGAVNAIQSGCNATLGKMLGQPFVAALVIVAVSFTSLLVCGLVLGQLALPESGRVGQVPWWGWVGGALGAFYVMSMLLAAETIGAAVFMGLTVTAAIVTSLVLDHFGWMGFRQHPAGLWRIVGGVMMISGLGLIAKF